MAVSVGRLLPRALFFYVKGTRFEEFPLFLDYRFGQKLILHLLLRQQAAEADEERCRGVRSTREPAPKLRRCSVPFSPGVTAALGPDVVLTREGGQGLFSDLNSG